MARHTSNMILNVDDNMPSLYARSRVLRNAGFTVIEAQTGKAALELATSAKPDLILLDVQLPDMTGYDVCRQLKSKRSTAQLFVLHISTAALDTQAKTYGLEGGADGYVTEPVEPDELIATIRAFLRLRQTEAALRESEDRLRVALEAGQMATWDWDLLQNRIVWSEQMERILGLDQGTFDGTLDGFIALIHPRDRKQFGEAMQRAIQDGADYRLELRMLHSSGTPSWIEARGRVYYDSNGQPVRMAGIYHDITERKQAAEALRTLNLTLEQRVQERTAQLERSNRELDQFAYVASHDLKAPLRGIDHLASWITQDAADVLPAASKEHLNKLRGRVQRMDYLLDDLLAYSRVGRRDGNAEILKTDALVRYVIGMLSPPAGLTIQLDDGMPTLVTPRVPLESVFRNLIDNAIKHHHAPETGTVRISAQSVGDFVEFCVSDNGPGIDQQYHERIFSIFQTLRPRDQVEGSGMGLAIVKKTVEYRGGTIRIVSAAGQGAAFYFTWPKQAREA